MDGARNYGNGQLVEYYRVCTYKTSLKKHLLGTRICMLLPSHGRPVQPVPAGKRSPRRMTLLKFHRLQFGCGEVMVWAGEGTSFHSEFVICFDLLYPLM